MVVIRLSRTGAKKSPFYHVVAKDKREKRDGACIERLGYFNPVAKGKEIRLNIKKDRLQYWLSNGAQPSDRVQSLIKEFEKHGERTALQYEETRPQPKKKVTAAEETEATEVDAAPAEAEESTPSEDSDK